MRIVFSIVRLIRTAGVWGEVWLAGHGRVSSPEIRTLEPRPSIRRVLYGDRPGVSSCKARAGLGSPGSARLGSAWSWVGTTCSQRFAAGGAVGRETGADQVDRTSRPYGGTP